MGQPQIHCTTSSWNMISPRRLCCKLSTFAQTKKAAYAWTIKHTSSTSKRPQDCEYQACPWVWHSLCVCVNFYMCMCFLCAIVCGSVPKPTMCLCNVVGENGSKGVTRNPNNGEKESNWCLGKASNWGLPLWRRFHSADMLWLLSMRPAVHSKVPWASVPANTKPWERGCNGTIAPLAPQVIHPPEVHDTAAVPTELQVHQAEHHQ